jgi:hypothetical protein
MGHDLFRVTSLWNTIATYAPIDQYEASLGEVLVAGLGLLSPYRDAPPDRLIM